ncbi:unnamed protein product [Brassicogethes aeneus]|uniref:SCP domain-containing protein n=1 Tax=Brassicogethes aeneus TaxID=1431903 RepID=A0A9P0ATX6_BRAAE|nr:unnamed protein product [Brassicogethes aeneus]
MTKVLVLLFIASVIALASCRNSQPCLTSVMDEGMNDNDRLRILELHNNLRKRIREGREVKHPIPAPGELLDLEYDMNLERIARESIKLVTCDEGYILEDANFGDIGMNRYTHQTSSLDMALEKFPTKNTNGKWSNAFRHFTREKHDFEYKKINQPLPYTQVIWGKTRRIGCAYIFGTKDDPETPYSKYYLCHYYPGGNVFNKFPYEIASTKDSISKPDYEDFFIFTT